MAVAIAIGATTFELITQVLDHSVRTESSFSGRCAAWVPLHAPLVCERSPRGLPGRARAVERVQQDPRELDPALGLAIADAPLQPAVRADHGVERGQRGRPSQRDRERAVHLGRGERLSALESSRTLARASAAHGVTARARSLHARVASV